LVRIMVRFMHAQILPALKMKDSPSDAQSMVSFTTEIWLALAVLGVAAVLGMLYGLATQVSNEKQAHDVRAKVALLRNQYTAKLAGQADDDEDDVIIVDGPSEGLGLRDAA